MTTYTPMVAAAARVLSDRAAEACNVDAEDNWKLYGEMFLEDAKAALDAAGASAYSPDGAQAPAAVPLGWNLTRNEHGIAVWKDGVGGYAARQNDASIASAILYELANDLLAAAPDAPAPAPAPAAQPEQVNAATLAQIAAVRPDSLESMHGITAPAARPVEPSEQDEDAERVAFYAALNEATNLMGRAPYGFDLWLMARGRMTTNGRRTAQPVEPPDDARDALQAQMLEALQRAQGFIRNGIALGYIRMPDLDCPDPAHETPLLIDAAIDAARTALTSKGGAA